VHTSLLVAAALMIAPCLAAPPYFAIQVVDDQTGRGVPLVELLTTNEIRYATDSNGLVAFYEPGLMDRSVFFHVRSHGYTFPKDGFGYAGKALMTAPGTKATLRVHRVNIAERLYRITGQGIYADSVLLGETVPLAEPLLNGRVMGQDSALATLYRGRVFWLWGDTGRPEYPLGNFHTSGATSKLPGDGGLSPDKGVDLAYFCDASGFTKQMANVGGEGPTWLGGLTALRDADGKERLFAHFAKVHADMKAYRTGIVEYSDDEECFRVVVDFGATPPALTLDGHTFQETQDGVPYVYVTDPFPLTRVRATVEDLLDPARYEAYTCLSPGATSPDDLERDAGGKLVYGWKRATPLVGVRRQAELVKAGKMKPAEGLLQVRDVLTGDAVEAHNGSTYPNAYRGRYVAIFTQMFGSSVLGEIWYAEADTPVGPWVYARKIITHDRYSFYNPVQHPFFAEDGGRRVYFEGTYTATFSGNEDKTPRYDYNQIMYRLDLADPRLSLPVPVYGTRDADGRERFATLRDMPGGKPGGAAAFFACDHPGEGTVPVYRRADGSLQTTGTPDASGAPVFHALPADVAPPPGVTVPLYEVAGPDGRPVQTLDPDTAAGARVVCRVWKCP
jgi:hypothetical protein